MPDDYLTGTTGIGSVTDAVDGSESEFSFIHFLFQVFVYSFLLNVLFNTSVITLSNCSSLFFGNDALQCKSHENYCNDFCIFVLQLEEGMHSIRNNN